MFLMPEANVAPAAYSCDCLVIMHTWDQLRKFGQAVIKISLQASVVWSTLQRVRTYTFMTLGKNLLNRRVALPKTWVYGFCGAALIS